MNSRVKIAIGILPLIAVTFGSQLAIGLLLGTVAQLIALPLCALAGLGYGNWAYSRRGDPPARSRDMKLAEQNLREAIAAWDRAAEANISAIESFTRTIQIQSDTWAMAWDASLDTLTADESTGG